MRMQNIIRVSNLQNTHYTVSLSYICHWPCQISLFSFKFGLIVICPAFCGNVNTNARESLQTVLPSIRMSYDCLLRICFSYQYYEHVSNLRKTPILLTNTQRMLINTYELLAIIGNGRPIAFVSPNASIFA